jgi:hypothetical protein
LSDAQASTFAANAAAGCHGSTPQITDKLVFIGLKDHLLATEIEPMFQG